jgi:8-oxo-dGTP pyrophosphatase MutT (NUDIX family)
VTEIDPFDLDGDGTIGVVCVHGFTGTPYDMRFLGGYYAFPGGKVDLADRSHDALARTRGLSAENATRAIGDPDDEVPALAYWLAGVREVFEETGMLLARDGEDQPVAAGAPDVAHRLEDHRRALVRGERSFTAILAEEGLVADLAPLRYLSTFVTPPASPIRFSARFFLCPVPPDQGPRLTAEEASEGFWVDPAKPTGASAPASGRWRSRGYGTQISPSSSRARRCGATMPTSARSSTGSSIAWMSGATICLTGRRWAARVSGSVRPSSGATRLTPLVGRVPG